MTVVKIKKTKKKCVVKRKIKFENYKKCLVAQLENEINYLEKIKST